MKKASELSRFARLRQIKYLNDEVEQDHRRIKRLGRPGLGSNLMRTAQRIIAGYETFAMIRGPMAMLTSAPVQDILASAR
jgi:transposase, IS6 family